MGRKKICKALIEKGVKARICFFYGVPEDKWKDKAPMCNSFVHGVRDASIATGVFTAEEAMRVENAADAKVMDEEALTFEQFDMIELPPDDSISTCSYKKHLRKYLLIRFLSLLCGIGFGFSVPFFFL